MAYVIREKCVGCHYCEMECPEGAIDFVGRFYQIDPEKCTDCGLCAELCPISIITNPDIPDAEPKKHDLIKRSCDVAVCGAGGAGLVAAVKLTELGYKVIVLEKAKKAGGDTTLGHGFRILGSRAVIEELGVPDVAQETINHKYNQVKDTVDYETVRDFLLCSGRFFDWMWEMPGTKKYFKGATFAMEPSAILEQPVYQNLKSRDRSIGPGWCGTFTVVKMLEKCQEYGIEILYEHRASKLLKNESGGVCGIMADDPGGQTQIDAKAVILATGCLGHDDERMKRICPSYVSGEVPVYKQMVPTNTGDALYMVEEAGGIIDEDNIDISQNGPMHHPYSYTVFRLMGAPEAIQINLDGKRFQSEAMRRPGSMPGLPHVRSDGGIIYQQPKCMAYTIMDDALLEKRGQELVANPPDFDGHILRHYREDVEKEVRLGYPAKKADTLEDLAKEMGIDPDAFVAEIEKYNQFCANGKDEDFDKDSEFLTPILKPPFYAFFGHRFSEQATGGVVIDRHLRVIDTEGNPIPGLYAVGSTTQGANKLGSEVVTGGLTWALGSGYMAAEKISETI